MTSPPAKTTKNPGTNDSQNSSGKCTKSHVLGRASDLAEDSICKGVNAKTTGNPDARVMEPPTSKDRLWQGT